MIVSPVFIPRMAAMGCEQSKQEIPEDTRYQEFNACRAAVYVGLSAAASCLTLLSLCLSCYLLRRVFILLLLDQQNSFIYQIMPRLTATQLFAHVDRAESSYIHNYSWFWRAYGVC